MSRTRKNKKAKKQGPQAELNAEQLDQVSGGIVAPRPLTTSSPVQEGPEESITFVYGKLGVKY
jgi:hypothetical protein